MSQGLFLVFDINDIGKYKDECQHGEKSTASSSFKCFITVTAEY